MRALPCTPLLLIPFLALLALPSGATTLYADQGNLIRAPKAVGVLGSDLFGDKVNLYSGALSFTQTDVSLQGNNSLPVAMGRFWNTGVSDSAVKRAFGQWDMEIPHLHGIFSQGGWKVATGVATARCSNFGKPPAATSNYGGQGSWNALEFWHGNFMYIPGLGDQELLRKDISNANVPSLPAPSTAVPKPYPVVTTGLWSVSCLPTLKNDLSATHVSGEGFLAVSPTGDTYRFDWMVYRAMSLIEKGTAAPDNGAGGAPGKAAAVTSESTDVAAEVPAHPDAIDGEALARNEVWILPTVVTDRFGNTVTYTYDPLNPWHLTSITGTSVSGVDGRSLKLTYVTGRDLVSTITDGTRTWTYQYDSTFSHLDSVTLPDKSAWKLSEDGALGTQIDYSLGLDCNAYGFMGQGPVTGRMTHPSGAVGEFTLTPTLHGRSQVINKCMTTTSGGQTTNYFRYFGTYSLTSKVISGPGLTPMTWLTEYSPADGSWSTCTTCSVTKSVYVTDPSGNKTSHTFGTVYQKTEGRLQRTEVVNHDGAPLSTTDIVYSAAIVPVGKSDQGRGDGEQASFRQVTEKRTTTQQGVDFTWQLTDPANINPVSVDAMGRPTDVTKKSTLGYSRREVTTYNDNKNKWILSQVEKVTEPSTGLVPVLNVYDPTYGTLKSVTRFGLLEKSMTYGTDGTLATSKDARNPATTFSNYKFGIAQNVQYADLSTESAVVNSIGLLDSTTDANGYTTNYKYDAAGRLSKIIYPTADSTVWNDTTLVTAQSTVTELGLSPGHWTQTVATGYGRSVTYLDALMRPVYTMSYELAYPATTGRVVQRRFDSAGHTIFESYPQRTAAETLTGTSTEYDGLGRVVKVSADSELGVLTTTTSYDSGFLKTVTDPKFHSTTTGFQVFDQPVETAITSIAAPLGVQVNIARDVFGKTTSITRSGSGKSARRSYVYDANARLCKTIEPETGATVQDYDAANNVLWRATGLALPSTTSCDLASVVAAKKMSFTYDALNRLKTTTYGDLSAGITRDYWADGLPKTVSSGGTEWAYQYNKRRLNESEVLAYGGKTYALTKTFDANGFPSTLKYPDNSVIDYKPTSLGLPSQVGTYATAIVYHPNGALKSFKYGNGIVHTLKQNLRGLPEISADAGVMSDTYAFDKNGNVGSITDNQENISSRVMGYDDLDRLATVSAPALWKNAVFHYDALDNLIDSTITAGAGTRTLIHEYDATNKLSATTGTAGFAFKYGYDSQGNITQRGAQSFEFDQGNRLKSAPGKATYLYDGLGRRMSVVGTDGVNRVQIYGQAGQILYAGPTGGTGTKYIYLNNHVIAEVAQ